MHSQDELCGGMLPCQFAASVGGITQIDLMVRDLTCMDKGR